MSPVVPSGRYVITERDRKIIEFQVADKKCTVAAVWVVAKYFYEMSIMKV